MPRRVLAVLNGGVDDARVLAHSCALALENGGRLTVLYVWRPSPWTRCAVFAGIDPARLVADCEEQAAQSLRRAIGELPARLPCTLLCRRQARGRDVIGEVLEAGIDCLIAGRGSLGRRQQARLRRRCPDVQLRSLNGGFPRRRDAASPATDASGLAVDPARAG